jgi:hypothetical protein
MSSSSSSDPLLLPVRVSPSILEPAAAAPPAPAERGDMAGVPASLLLRRSKPPDRPSWLSKGCCCCCCCCCCWEEEQDLLLPSWCCAEAPLLLRCCCCCCPGWSSSSSSRPSACQSQPPRLPLSCVSPRTDSCTLVVLWMSASVGREGSNGCSCCSCCWRCSCGQHYKQVAHQLLEVKHTAHARHRLQQSDIRRSHRAVQLLCTGESIALPRKQRCMLCCQLTSAVAAASPFNNDRSCLSTALAWPAALSSPASAAAAAAAATALPRLMRPTSSLTNATGGSSHWLARLLWLQLGSGCGVPGGCTNDSTRGGVPAGEKWVEREGVG